MGTKYIALCSVYPYKGYAELEIQSEHFIPFLFKLIKASHKYQIIDIHYRNC